MANENRTEKGPWTVEIHDGEIRIDSGDFNHDVCLLVRGDLGGVDGGYMRAYAERLCAILNAAMPITF